MKLIPTDKLYISKSRLRRQFDPRSLADLADSIESKGLLHPLVVRHDRESALFELVAGERRARAITILHEADRSFLCNGVAVEHWTFPTIYIDHLPPDLLLEAELEENLLRDDLTWQEKEQAIARLHELRSTQTEGTQSLTATARELSAAGAVKKSFDATDVRDSLLLSKHLDEPEISGADSRESALKVLRDKLIKTLTGGLAAQATARIIPHEFIHGSFMLPAQADGRFSVIVTDPPYGVGAPGFGSQSVVSHTYTDSPLEWEQLMTTFSYHATLRTASKAHAYIFCAMEKFFILQDIMTQAGWLVWSRPLIWVKGGGIAPDVRFGPRNTYDAILFARKGDLPTTSLYADVLEGRLSGLPVRGAEKPVEIYMNLLRRSARPGDFVWDPFCGSGPIFRAAAQLNCLATGHDTDADAIELARGLLENEAGGNRIC
jgi:ParB/RepB/Spo0J family partition protein